MRKISKKEVMEIPLHGENYQKRLFRFTISYRLSVGQGVFFIQHLSYHSTTMYVVVCILKKSLKSPDVLLVYLKNVSIFCSAYIEIDNTVPMLLFSISDGVGDIFETRKLDDTKFSNDFSVIRLSKN